MLGFIPRLRAGLNGENYAVPLRRGLEGLSGKRMAGRIVVCLGLGARVN